MERLIQFGNNDVWKEKAAVYSQWILARVIAQYKGLYKVMTEEGECFAETAGKFHYENTELLMYPAVGDFVLVSNIGTNERVFIHKLLPRKSVFTRTAVGMYGQVQVVAANMDWVFICMSLNQNYNLSRLERYLSISWDSGATPVIVLTKADLCEDLLYVLQGIQQTAVFTDVITVSIEDIDIEEKFSRYIKSGDTATFIGSSGVGKSTLINRLLGKEELATSQIGRADKGRHTTIGRELFFLPTGGMVIDTPGMRELGVEQADLSKSFHDIEMLADNCRFNDCSHTKEPGCAVRQAIADGNLELRRLENFNKIRLEARYDGLSSKQIEEDKMERMFKEFGGVKNAKKMLKNMKKYRR